VLRVYTGTNTLSGEGETAIKYIETEKTGPLVNWDRRKNVGCLNSMEGEGSEVAGEISVAMARKIACDLEAGRDF